MAFAAHPALDRILSTPERRAAFDMFSADLSGSDLTTLLLGVFERRAERCTAAGVRKQYDQDRFVRTAPVSALQLVRVEIAALEAAHEHGFEAVCLAPVAPLGLHHVLGDTPQNNVISTSRGTEVAADPTNVLALEAAVRRTALLADSQTRGASVQLATTQRVTRAQHFDGTRSFAHFSTFGMLTAGRDQGDSRFELAAIRRHTSVALGAVRRLTPAPVLVRLTPFNNELADACRDLCGTIAQHGVQCEVWSDRDHGRGYYSNVGFKIYVEVADEVVEVGDGGDVPWMQKLMQSRKERTFIGGLGLERLALLLAEKERLD